MFTPDNKCIHVIDEETDTHRLHDSLRATQQVDGGPID